jgi:hypothetical protein
MGLEEELSYLYSRMRRKSARSALAGAGRIIHHIQWQYPPSLEASNVAVQRLLVQQPVQQRRRKTANIGDTQRTSDPGMKHAEDVSEGWRTRSSVSRMRYHPSP